MNETAVERMRRELYPTLDNAERALVEVAINEARRDGRAELGGVLRVTAELGLQAVSWMERFVEDGDDDGDTVEARWAADSLRASLTEAAGSGKAAADA